MNNLNQMKEKLLERKIPEDLNDKTNCFEQITSFSRTVSAMNGLLLADAQIKNFDNNAAKTLDWGVAHSGRDRNTIMRLLRIGRVLIDVEKDVFNIMKYLSSDKNIELLTLPKKDIPKFILSRGKKLIKMTRDELRAEIYEVLGKELKSGQAKSDKYQPDMFEVIDAFLEVDDSKLDNLFMDERFNGSTVSKYYKSGMVLVENVVNYLNVRGGSPEVIATAEQQLRAQADKLAEIRERMTLREVS